MLKKEQFMKKLLNLAIMELVALLSVLIFSLPVQAANQTATNSIEGIIPSPPPSQGATITLPASGSVFSSQPITVSGLCPSGLLIKIFDNNVFVGSVYCQNGSYTLQIDLFSGQNDLTAIDYDALDQAGPTSNSVSVSYNGGQFIASSVPLSLTSNYAERGAAPGSEIDWPIIINGGSPPYAISVDWGDGNSAELISQQSAGTVIIKHNYNIAGLYQVIIKATDVNGQNAFLQVVGQATGAIQANNNTATKNQPKVIREIIWWPELILLIFIVISFWLGRRQQISSFKKRFGGIY